MVSLIITVIVQWKVTLRGQSVGDESGDTQEDSDLEVCESEESQDSSVVEVVFQVGTDEPMAAAAAVSEVRRCIMSLSLL